MVIQLPEWGNWRIQGADDSWQIQQKLRNKRHEVWSSIRSYKSLDGALGYAYERTLKESASTATTAALIVSEFDRARERLLRAARLV